MPQYIHRYANTLFYLTLLMFYGLICQRWLEHLPWPHLAELLLGLVLLVCMRSFAAAPKKLHKELALTLKKAGFHRGWLRKKQSLSLILGPSKSGKSALLATDYQPIDQTTPAQSQEAYGFQLWQSRHDHKLYYLECSADLLATLAHNSAKKTILIPFLKIIKRYAHVKRLMITMALSNIIQHHDTQSQALQDVSEMIKKIADILGTIPCQIVFTHMDLIAGFSTFFHHLPKDKQQQPWGIDLTLNHTTFTWHQAFQKGYQHFVSDLNTQMFARLSQTQDPKTH